MKHIIYIGNKLESRGYSPTTIDLLTPLFREESYKVTAVSSKKNKLFRLLDMVRTLFKLKKQADYVLIDTYSTANFWYAIICGKICRRYNLPYLPLLHGGNLPHRLQNNEDVCKKFFGNAWVNIAPSNYLLQEFSRYGYFNLKFIPNPFQLRNYSFKERKILQPKLLWVRAFANIYNPLLAIKVMELLLDDYPEAELCMVGGAKDETMSLCKEYAKKNNLNVSFTGKLSKEDWLFLARDYFIFLNTSTVDNIPTSVLEAMAMGLPVVSTNVGGMPYLINNKKEGLLVNKDKAQEMAMAVKLLLESPGLSKEISNAARAKAETFDWEVVKTKWFQVLA